MFIEFEVKKYLFIFIDNNIYIIEIYTKKQIIKELKVFYNLIYIYTKLDKPIKRL